VGRTIQLANRGRCRRLVQVIVNNNN
jgi:hypothetical protein